MPQNTNNLRRLIYVMSLIPLSSFALFKSDSKETVKPDTPAIITEIPINFKKKAPSSTLFNECEECVKENRKWRFDNDEIKSVIERCGADYLLTRYERKFIDKDCEISTQQYFSIVEDVIRLDSVRILQKWPNGKIEARIITNTQSDAFKITIDAPLTIANPQMIIKNFEKIALYCSDFESRIVKTKDKRYHLYFRLGENAWTLSENTIASIEWRWPKSCIKKSYAGYMVGYAGENPHREGACFSEQKSTVVFKKISVDYPLNLCRITLEIESVSPLKKLLFSAADFKDSIVFAGEKSVGLSKILSLDKNTRQLFMEISDIYGNTFEKKIPVYDKLRKYYAEKDTAQRIHRIKDSLSARNFAFKTANFVSKFDGNPIGPLLHKYCDWKAWKILRENGKCPPASSLQDTLTKLKK